MPNPINKIISQRIPLAKFMGIQVVVDQDEIYIHAPLDVNRNHMGTGFAGSLSSICILCGWAQTFHFVGTDFAGDVVLKDAQLRYLRPVETDIVARVLTPDQSLIKDFKATYERARRASLALRVEINAGEKKAVTFRGTYTAFDT